VPLAADEVVTRHPTNRRLCNWHQAERRLEREIARTPWVARDAGKTPRAVLVNGPGHAGFSSNNLKGTPFEQRHPRAEAERALVSLCLGFKHYPDRREWGAIFPLRVQTRADKKRKPRMVWGINRSAAAVVWATKRHDKPP
jgi:hypothetical protein